MGVGYGIWMGRDDEEVRGRARGDVVAFKSCAGLFVQVDTIFTFLFLFW